MSEPRIPPARTEASAAPVRKVLAGFAGAGFGAASAKLLTGGLADILNNGHPIPSYLSGWLNIAVPAVCSLAAGYYVRRAPGE